MKDQVPQLSINFQLKRLSESIACSLGALQAIVKELRDRCYIVFSELGWLSLPFIFSPLLNEFRYKPSPSSLMTGTHSGSVITVEVFVKENQITPVRVSLKLFSTPIHGAAID